MLRARQRLRHCIGQLEVGRDGHDSDLAELDPVSNMVIVDVDMLGPVRLRQSAGPFSHPLLSSNILILFGVFVSKQVFNFNKDRASLAESEIAIYSASVVERAVTDCW